MTFSAKQELSGWQAPAAASEEEEQSQFTAAGTRPRLFVVFEDGSGYEVLDQGLFTAYAQRKVWLKIFPRCQPCMGGFFVKGNASFLGSPFLQGHHIWCPVMLRMSYLMHKWLMMYRACCAIGHVYTHEDSSLPTRHMLCASCSLHFHIDYSLHVCPPAQRSVNWYSLVQGIHHGSMH